ncbi:MAG: hypothetical protein V1808_03450 [Candidatus Daviesbacteria bacterium]
MVQENNAEEQLTLEDFKQRAAEIERRLPLLGRKILQRRVSLIKYKMAGTDPAIMRNYEIAAESLNADYYRLLGFKEGVQAVVNNNDPRPLMEKLFSDAEDIVKQK